MTIFKNITILFFLIISFLFGFNIKATTILESLPTGSLGCVGIGCLPTTQDTLKQTITFSNSATFNHIVVKLDIDEAIYNNFRINICDTLDCSGGLDVALSEGIDFNLPITNYPDTCDEIPTTDIELDNDITLSAGTYYFYLTYGVNSNPHVRFCTGEDKITGCFIFGPSSTTCITDGWDFWFQIYHDSLTPTTPQYTIQLITPATTTPFTTYYGQPASYTFNYINPLNWYPQIRFMVKRKADAMASAWPDYVNSANFSTSVSATSTLTFGTKSFTLPDGYYDLRVDYWANTPPMLGMASTTFTINSGGSYGGYSFATSTLIKPPTFSTSDLCGDIATTTTFGAIECGLTKAFVNSITWAFAPSFDTLTNFKVSFELFKGCFPFNTYFQLTDTITYVASSTATSTIGTIKIPFISSMSSSSDFYMMSVISSSTLSNWIGVSNYNLFRTTIGYFFWLIACAIVFFTIKFI